MHRITQRNQMSNLLISFYLDRFKSHLLQKRRTTFFELRKKEKLPTKFTGYRPAGVWFSWTSDGACTPLLDTSRETHPQIERERAVIWVPKAFFFFSFPFCLWSFSDTREKINKRRKENCEEETVECAI